MVGPPTSSSIATNQCISTIVDMSVNDFVEMTCLQTSGGNLNSESSGVNSPQLSMFLIGN